MKIHLKTLSVVLACFFVTYVGSYAYLSANGRYEPFYMALPGFYRYSLRVEYLWHEEGLFPDGRTRLPTWKRALVMAYFPLIFLDMKYWHQDISFGEKTKYTVDEVSGQYDTLWMARTWLFPPRSSYYNYKKYEEDRQGAVKEMRKHPLKMAGTILYGHDGLYVVQAVSDTKEVPPDKSTGGTAGGSPITGIIPMVLEGKGGQCYLVSRQPHAAKETLSITVYPAGEAPIGEEKCLSYSDDPNLAYAAGYIKHP